MSTADVPDRLLLDYRLDSGVAVVKVTGEVDVSTSSSLRNSLLRVITDENHHGLSGIPEVLLVTGGQPGAGPGRGGVEHLAG